MNISTKYNPALYETITKDIAALERAEKRKIQNLETQAEKKEAQLNYIKTKYEILRITSRYGLLMSLVSLYDGFRLAFTKSSENRWHLLTDSFAKVNVDTDDPDALGQLIKKGEAGYDSLSESKWLEWPGCGMHIPENTHIVTNSNVTWPSIYFSTKNEGKQGQKSEINVYERAWNADIFTSEPGLVKQLKENQDQPIIKGYSSVSETRVGLDGQQKFRHVSLEIQEKLEEFDIVIEVPFIAPFLDVLTQISFKDSNSQSDVLLTLCTWF